MVVRWAVVHPRMSGPVAPNGSMRNSIHQHTRARTNNFSGERVDTPEPMPFKRGAQGGEVGGGGRCSESLVVRVRRSWREQKQKQCASVHPQSEA